MPIARNAVTWQSHHFSCEIASLPQVTRNDNLYSVARNDVSSCWFVVFYILVDDQLDFAVFEEKAKAFSDFILVLS